MCGTAITTGFHWLLWPVVATVQACQWWRLATGQATTYDEISVHPSVKLCLSLRPADSPVDTACVPASELQAAGGAGVYARCFWHTAPGKRFLPMRKMRGLMVCNRLDMSSLECNFGWIDDLCMKGRQVPPVAHCRPVPPVAHCCPDSICAADIQ